MMKRVSKLMLVAAITLGLAVGLGAFTFGYARGYSYLTNDPSACANCHVMSEHFAAWSKSSHHAVATCNDCHTPHTLVGKYVTKAKNGFWHSFYFTTGTYPDPIRITAGNRRVTEHACRECHADITDAIEAMPSVMRHASNATGADARMQTHTDAQISCIRCHSYVGHWVR